MPHKLEVGQIYKSKHYHYLFKVIEISPISQTIICELLSEHLGSPKGYRFAETFYFIEKYHILMNPEKKNYAKFISTHAPLIKR